MKFRYWRKGFEDPGLLSSVDQPSLWNFLKLDPPTDLDSSFVPLSPYVLPLKCMHQCKFIHKCKYRQDANTKTNENTEKMKIHRQMHDGQNVLEWRLKMDGGPWLESKTGTLEMFFPSGQNYDDFHDDHKWWCDDDWEKTQLTKLVN